MKKEEKTKKQIKQNCPLCNYSYVKKYISTHLKNIHPDSEYSKIINRGVKYNLEKNPIFTSSDEMRYCKICKKLIKKKCFWVHLKTFLHKKLFETTFMQKEVGIIRINKIKNLQKDFNNNIPINKSQKDQKDDELKSSLSKISKRNNNFLIPQCFEYHEKFFIQIVKIHKVK